MTSEKLYFAEYGMVSELMNWFSIIPQIVGIAVLLAIIVKLARVMANVVYYFEVILTISSPQ